MRFTLVMLAAVPLASSFAPSGGFNLAKVGAPAVAHPRAASLSARRPARLLDLKATAAAPLVVAESEYTVPEWRKKVDLKAWADEVRAVEKKYRQAQGEEDVKHMKKMLNWTYVLYAIGEPSCVAPLSLVTHRGIYINLRRAVSTLAATALSLSACGIYMHIRECVCVCVCVVCIYA
jgi:hypothetical protein